MGASYKKFIIKKYKAISKPISIDVSKGTGVFPMVGINESGKTTILHAIMAFDHRNDSLNDTYFHLKDVGNKYTNDNTAEISATLEIDKDTLIKLVEYINDQEKQEHFTSVLASVEKAHIEVSRTIESQSNREQNEGRYKFNFREAELQEDKFLLEDSEQQNICVKILEWTPLIFYFDDFRDKVASEIDLNGGGEPIYNMFERMFREFCGDPEYNLRNLQEREENIIHKMVAKVSSGLNDLVIEKWKEFGKRLDGGKKEKLLLDLRYELGKLKLKIKETIGDDENFFYADQRSKGFYWFLNFIFKTRFNSKSGASKGHIYLLDEPGSYLHSSAQMGLCGILKELGKDNIVIYNTHSQYLLHEDFLDDIRIPYKEVGNKGNIKLVHYSDYKNRAEQLEAWQPIYDALDIKPSTLNENYMKENLILVEGITDFFSFRMFLGEEAKDVGFVPGKNADKVAKHVPFALAYKGRVLCLLDGDKAGTEAKEKIEESYSEGGAVGIVQFDEETGATEGLYDIEELKALEKVGNVDFGSIKSKKDIKKKLPALYKKRKELVAKLPKTKAKFVTFYKERLVNALKELEGLK